MALTTELTLFITGSKFLIKAILSAKRHATPREIKANNKRDLLLTFSVMQNDSQRLMHNLISSVGEGTGQRESLRSTFCTEAIKSPVWEKEHIGANTLNVE